MIYVSNHQSHLDPVLVGVAVHDRPFASMARDTLFDPPFGFMIKACGAIPIKRGQGDRAAVRALLQALEEGRSVLVEEPAIDQQALRRPANSRAPGLRVHHDAPRLFDVSRLVDVDVADAFEMGEDRHPRLCLHAAHQPLAAARNDHVHIIRRRQHRADKGAVPRRRDLDRIFRQVRGP